MVSNNIYGMMSFKMCINLSAINTKILPEIW